MIYFSPCKFDGIKTVTTKGFLPKLHRVINSRLHLHHSHVTGEIIGDSHDFCNWKIRENQDTVSLIGHNFLSFDIFCMVKGFRATCWGTKDFSMGGTNLTNVNFARIGSQIKIIDTLKYYQMMLSNLSSTADEKEKKTKLKKQLNYFY